MERRTALIGYDGSAGARRAVRAAAEVVDGPCVVLNIVQADPVVPASPMGPALPGEHIDALEREAVERGQEVADEGAALARSVGLEADALVAHIDSSEGVAGALVEAAHEVGADMIAIGTSGRGPLKAAILGSTSYSVLAAADRPAVLVADPG